MSSGTRQGAPPNQFTFKIILVGNTGVGKRSLVLRYTDNYFGEPILTTICVDFRTKELHFPGVIANLHLWDTAGQERYGNLGPNFYRGADAIVLMFDLTNAASFQSIGHWLKNARDHTSDQCLLLLVGNKADVTDKRAVPRDTASSYAESIGMRYVETSAKTSGGVEAAFQQMAETLVKKRQEESPASGQDDPTGYVDIRARQNDSFRIWCVGGNACSTI